jgi:transcriptional regulator with XRE-family HTH domain
MEPSVNAALADRLRSLRAARGWTLERFAEVSGVSRAMISKIERGEVSPTATILARLAQGLGMTLASLFTPLQATPDPLLRWEDQQDWRDPESGYVRRNVSPPGTKAELVYVTFPAGARVVFDNASGTQGFEQQVWLLEGEMALTVGDRTLRLGTGDTLAMSLDAPLVFHNPSDHPARYVVVIMPRHA